MQFITGNSRHQTYFATLGAFIEKPELENLDFIKTVHKRDALLAAVVFTSIGRNYFVQSVKPC